MSRLPVPYFLPEIALGITTLLTLPLLWRYPFMLGGEVRPEAYALFLMRAALSFAILSGVAWLLGFRPRRQRNAISLGLPGLYLLGGVASLGGLFYAVQDLDGGPGEGRGLMGALMGYACWLQVRKIHAIHRKGGESGAA